jgi:hypothetical protein
MRGIGGVEHPQAGFPWEPAGLRASPSGEAVFDKLPVHVSLLANGSHSTERLQLTINWKYRPFVNDHDNRHRGAEMTAFKPGQQAPPFEAMLPDGGRVRLADYRDKTLILIFLRHLA